jgi:hypothetical protein
LSDGQGHHKPRRRAASDVAQGQWRALISSAGFPGFCRLSVLARALEDAVSPGGEDALATAQARLLTCRVATLDKVRTGLDHAGSQMHHAASA